MDSLHQVNRELIEKQEQLQTLAEKMQITSDSLQADEDFLKETHSLVSAVHTFRTCTPTSSISLESLDSFISTPGALHTRLLDAVASDEAIKEGFKFEFPLKTFDCFKDA